ncbi:hypothetical protein [Rhizobium sp. SYY.PMSO]|uniref:hypothetical protein n=1 Tax=Rhizobium sp. SYY.PMSO TaxID=3382192 RepID=UPI00398FDF08
MRNSRYMSRALASKDGRFAVVLGKLGHIAPISSRSTGKPQSIDSVPPASCLGLSSNDGQAAAELTSLRAEYQAVVGTRPYHGWNAEALRAKIAEAKEAI